MSPSKRAGAGPTARGKNGGAARNGGRSRSLLLGGTAIVLATFAVYLPAMKAGFIWDDDVYITANPHLDDAAGLRRIWLRPGATNQYYPLTFTTLWAERHLFGDRPAGYHLVNIALHTACALLFWALLRRLAIPGAWLAAAVFAVHPVFVESTAWVAELKNLQSGALCLLALLAFFRFSPPEAAETPAAPPRWRCYAVALVLFAAALASKTAVMPVPLVLPLVIWWKRGRLRAGDLPPLLPLAAMSIAMGAVTVWAERQFSGAGVGLWSATPVERCLVAGRAWWFYVGKLVDPATLVTVYPRWEVSASVWWQYLYPAAAAGVLLALWLLRGRIGRAPIVAALAYTLMLAPALGLVTIGYFRYSFVADHFQYHAAPALIALAAAGAAALREKPGARAWVPPCAAAVLLLLGVLSWRYAHAFASEQARCLDTLAKNPSCWLAMNNLGVELAAAGDDREAIGRYDQALRLNPDYPEAHNNLGVSLAHLGDLERAGEQYREAVRLWPGYAEAQYNLGVVLAMTGRPEDAVRHLREAVRIRPGYAKARTSLARALDAAGRSDEAVEQLEQVLALQPGNAEARAALARAHGLQQPAGRPPGH